MRRPAVRPGTRSHSRREAVIGVQRARAGMSRSSHGAEPVLEESIDPRPSPVPFASVLAARAAESGDPGALESWLRGWNDHASAWVNLRDIEHWIERSRR